MAKTEKGNRFVMSGVFILLFVISFAYVKLLHIEVMCILVIRYKNVKWRTVPLDEHICYMLYISIGDLMLLCSYCNQLRKSLVYIWVPIGSCAGSSESSYFVIANISQNTTYHDLQSNDCPH